MPSLDNIISGISTANLADAHDHLGTVCKWLTRDLGPTTRRRFWGFADVVQWGPTRKSADIQADAPSTWDEVKGFVDQLGPAAAGPRVYVAGCREISRDYVLLGGMSLSYLHRLGYAGVVSYGVIRDHDEVAGLDMPIWSAGFAIMDGQGCLKVESRAETCTVNGHLIRQGDVIVGDGNGVVALARDEVDEVLSAAHRIAAIEGDILSQIRGGADLYALVEGGGHI